MISINVLHCNHRNHWVTLLTDLMIKIDPDIKRKIKISFLNDKMAHKQPIFYESVERLRDNNVLSDVFEFGDVSYLTKIKHMIYNGDSDIVIKLDNDIFMNPHGWNYFLVNVEEVLGDLNNILFAPLISNGIPTVERFIDCFFDSEVDKFQIRNMFYGTNIPNIWGSDHSMLNCDRGDEWDGNAFFEKTRMIEGEYRGIHPVRINPSCQYLMNEKILANTNRFFELRECTHYSNDSPYFCNSVFAIKRETYKKVIESKDLYIDDFDEVPLNRYKNNNNMRFCFIDNAFAFHVIYNCIGRFDPQNYRKHEERYYQMLKKAADSYYEGGLL